MSLARPTVRVCPAATFALCAAVVLVTPAGAAAQEGTTEARDREARSLFEAGRTAFEDGRYADAREYFEHAYELSGRPELLYNIGSAEDRLRHDSEALTAFAGYLEAIPEAENRAEVEARITTLRAAVAEHEALETSSRAAAAAAPASGSGPTILWTWIAGAGALAFGGAAIGLWVLANDQYATLDRGCLALRGGCTAEEISASGVELDVTLTNVFFVGSLVLAGATALALVLELSSTPAATDGTSVSLRLAPGSVAIEGSF